LVLQEPAEQFKSEIKEERDFEEESEGDVRLERYCWRNKGDEAEAEEEGDDEDEESRVTRNDKDLHSRPPAPADELKSNHKSSHIPSSLGIDRVTTRSDNNSRGGSTLQSADRHTVIHDGSLMTQMWR
jgi:hypothetical protein